MSSETGSAWSDGLVEVSPIPLCGFLKTLDNPSILRSISRPWVCDIRPWKRVKVGHFPWVRNCYNSSAVETTEYRIWWKSCRGQCSRTKDWQYWTTRRWTWWIALKSYVQSHQNRDTNPLIRFPSWEGCQFNAKWEDWSFSKDCLSGCPTFFCIAKLN